MHQYTKKGEKGHENKEKEKEQNSKETAHLTGASLPPLLSEIPGVMEDQLSNAISNLHSYIDQQQQEIREYLSKFLADFLHFTSLYNELIDNAFNASIVQLNESHPVIQHLRQVSILVNSFNESPELEGFDTLKNILAEIQVCCQERQELLLKADLPTLTILTSGASISDEHKNRYLLDREIGLELANIDEFNHKKEKPFEGAHTVTRKGKLHFKLAGESESLWLHPMHEHAMSSLHNLFVDEEIIATPTMLINMRGVKVTEGSETKILSWPIQVSYTIEGILLLDLVTLVDLVNELRKEHGENLITHWPNLVSGDDQISFFDSVYLREYFDVRDAELNKYLKKYFLMSRNYFQIKLQKIK